MTPGRTKLGTRFDAMGGKVRGNYRTFIDKCNKVGDDDDTVSHYFAFAR